MGLRLTVQRQRWLASISEVAAQVPGLVPVVKGNGYGFGRQTLMPIAADLAPRIAVGTVYEAAGVPADRDALVLSPHLGHPDLGPNAILTIGHRSHVDALAGWRGRVVVKLGSSMRRYGVDPEGLGALLSAALDAGLDLVGFSIHLDLAGSAVDHRREIDAWLPDLDPALPLAISHVGPTEYFDLRATCPERSFQFRAGTALWHADKSLFHLDADVLDVHTIAANETAGYRAAPAPGDGHLVVVAAGSAHGVRALDGGRSPFHFARQRIEMLEPPHMHATLLFVATGQPCPAIGDRVDVQRPLITTAVDELVWAGDD
jgi:alanine racemase